MTRWIAGLIAVFFLVPYLIYSPPWLIQLTILIFSILAFWEYMGLTQKNLPLLKKIAGTLLGGATVYIFVFEINDFRNAVQWFTFIILSSSILHLGGKNELSERFSNLVAFVFGLFYLGLLIVHWGFICTLAHWKFWFFLMLACTFASDTGGYIFGHWLGKHKLSPRLSPGKTIEGFLGGILMALLGGFLVRLFFWPEISLLYLLVLSALIATIAPLGDLTESLMKRAMGVKDSGKFIPGHGGVLDRVDALLFAGPIVYYGAIYYLKNFQ